MSLQRRVKLLLNNVVILVELEFDSPFLFWFLSELNSLVHSLCYGEYGTISELFVYLLQLSIQLYDSFVLLRLPPLSLDTLWQFFVGNSRPEITVGCAESTIFWTKQVDTHFGSILRAKQIYSWLIAG